MSRTGQKKHIYYMRREWIEDYEDVIIEEESQKEAEFIRLEIEIDPPKQEISGEECSIVESSSQEIDRLSSDCRKDLELINGFGAMNQFGKHCCILCEFQALSIIELERHFSGAHRGVIYFECATCGAKYGLKRQLIAHQRRHKEKRQPMVMILCGICGFKCSSQSGFKKHHLSHAGEKPHCTVCDNKSVCHAKLQDHMRFHTAEKSYSCELCDYKCSDSTRLYYHKKVHSNERPFSCTICNVKFKILAYLNKHEKLHARERPFVCSVCPAKFKRSDYLAKHKLTHSQQKIDKRKQVHRKSEEDKKAGETLTN